MPRPSGTDRTIQRRAERATTQPHFKCARYLSRAIAATATTRSNIARSLFFKKRRGITVELTGPPPDCPSHDRTGSVWWEARWRWLRSNELLN